MYKVFINEKKIVLSQEPQDSPKTLNCGRSAYKYSIARLEYLSS